MADHVTSALKLRLADLERKRAQRDGQPGFETNVNEIDEAIAQIKGDIASRALAARGDAS